MSTGRSFDVISIDDIEPAGPGRAVRFIRRGLGLEAFGLNRFDIPAGTAGHEHDERESGQEEVVVIVAGSGVYRVDGDEVAVREGSVLRFDPHARRQPVAGPDGLAFIAIGAPRGAYEPHGPF